MNRRNLTRVVLAATVFGLARGVAATEQDAPLGRELLVRIRTLLESLRAPRLGPFLTEWPATSPSRAITPATLPVLKYSSVLAAEVPAFARSVSDELFRISPRLLWGQSYPASVVGAQFLENYGWTEIAGLRGPIPSEHVAVGFLMLGPATSYPRHRHEAEEIYVPLSGTASWQGGSGVWREEPPGSVIVHERDEPHAMHTASGPMLALYLWRSANLNQKAQFDPPLLDARGQGAAP
jgi:quercetin dioxygenase-like cupin family protein